MSNQLNSTLIEGNVVKNPELTKLQSGKSVAAFAIANHRYYRNSKGEPIDETTFIDVTCWDRLAENCGQYLKKGQAVRLVGRITQETWIDANQKNRNKLVIIAAHVELAVGGDDIKEIGDSMEQC
jgi:single-strand DNA-binding protein